MRIPQEASEIPDFIIAAAGYDKWVELCSKYGGQHWWIPTTPALSSRDIEIRRQFADIMSTPGVSQRTVYLKLARRFGVCANTIRSICK